MFPFHRHNSLRKNLAAYADGELSPGEAVAVEQHLAACDPCQAQLDGLRLASTALKELPVLAAPRSFALAPDMLGAPSPAPRSRAVPVYQTPLRLAAAGLAVALAAAMFADRSDFRGGDQSADEAQVAGLDERASDTLDLPADSAGAPAATSNPLESDDADRTNAFGAAEATQGPRESPAPAAGSSLDAGATSQPEYRPAPDDGDTKSNESPAAAAIDADTSQDGYARNADEAKGDDSMALTIVEVVLAVLLGAALGVLALAWISQRRNPL